MGLKYSESRPDSGYFVGYKLKVLEKFDHEKPNGFRFPQLGWLRVDKEIASTWFNRQPIEDINTLDGNVTDEKKPIPELLADLNEKMKNVSPERVEKLVSSTIRKDTRIINPLKRAANFKCQFPTCGQRIIKKKRWFLY